jgi:hypothetical protein
MSDRLTVNDKAYAEAQIKKMRKKYKKVSDSDRLTARDIETSEMIEAFQNDRTKGLPQEAYEQEDQSISYEAPKMNMGGEMVRGMGKAVKGFKKVIIR